MWLHYLIMKSWLSFGIVGNTGNKAVSLALGEKRQLERKGNLQMLALNCHSNFEYINYSLSET